LEERRDDSTTPTVSEGYDALAEEGDDLDPAGSPWGDSYFQRHYSWPATEAVLPDVAESRVLLAGCGRGDHVDWFLERGAEVVGVDASEAAVRIARERFGDEATFRVADLTDPLDFGDDAFDLVVSNLVLSHVEEWPPVFAEFHRVLTLAGTLAFATVHPLALRERVDASYYETAAFENDWPCVSISTYYRPIRAVLDALLSTGFRLEAFEEPTPRKEFREHHPDRYEAALTRPELLVVRARTD
jgi:SAM-dependent methyltransferase